MLTLLLLLPLAALLAFPLLPVFEPLARRASALVCGAQLTDHALAWPPSG